ncbi:hypothetical protein FZEAL_3545 [Fusarium zealandicum]|uniref:ADF-H domain-containing protein n=1 Tax=Fusarium zealandicum TaxID=1053134 RepID=A0A8H4UNJ6_9HYPO|nr:hypothetical protein FZEAL_3545 [Fusarium zealandicum]
MGMPTGNAHGEACIAVARPPVPENPDPRAADAGLPAQGADRLTAASFGLEGPSMDWDSRPGGESASPKSAILRSTSVARTGLARPGWKRENPSALEQKSPRARNRAPEGEKGLFPPFPAPSPDRPEPVSAITHSSKRARHNYYYYYYYYRYILDEAAVDMSGLDAPEVAAAYDAVRSDKEEANWLLISYAGAVGNKLTLTKTGSGGLAELVSELDDGQVQYGYVRVEYANDKESTRVKFALVVWIGDNTKVMRKARVSIESGDVKRALSHHSIAVTTSDRTELDERDVVTRLRKVGGADYNGGRG